MGRADRLRCEVNEKRWWPGSSIARQTRSWWLRIARLDDFAGHSMQRNPMSSRNVGQVARKLFAEGGLSVRIEPPFFCDYGFNIRLGESVYFNYNCIVLDVCEVRIGSFTMFGPAVQIYTALHPMNAELRRRVEYGKPVEIGPDVWVGGGAIICPGVQSAREQLSAPAAL